MKFKIRKLKIEDDDGETQSIVSLSIPAEFIIYAPPLQPSTTSGSRSRSQKQPSPGFESSMALTSFILITALFFMGFFSVYLRCVDSGRRRRSRRAEIFISNTRLQQLAAAAVAASSLSSSSDNNNNNNPSKDDDQGLDPIIIRSLPILPYNCNYTTSINNGGGGGGGCGRLELEDGRRIIEGKNGKNGDDRVVVLVDEDKDDCVVCLCEYEEGEMVKVIPNCGHMFHPECIDLWFISHSSCPLCRSTQLFPPSPPDQKKQQQKEDQKQQEDDDDELMKSTMVVVVMMRRAYSFSGGFSSDYSSSSSSSLGRGGGGGDNIERLVSLKRSSSWS